MTKKMVTYTDSYQWIEYDEDVVRVGLTKEGVASLGEIVYVEVPERGQELTEDGPACIVESTKAATEINSPVTGSVVAVNKALAERPSLLNVDPEGEGWLFVVKKEEEG